MNAYRGTRTIRCVWLLAFSLMGLASCVTRRTAGSDLRDQRIMIGESYALPHAVVFSQSVRALEMRGYAIRLRDSSAAEGLLTTTPRFTWIECIVAERIEAGEHPGIVAMVSTRSSGDSTRVWVGAVTVNRVPDVTIRGKRMSVDVPLRLCTITQLMSALDSLLLGKADHRHAAPGAETRAPLVAPLRFREFALTDTQHFSMPGAGTGYRYRGPGDLRPDVYIYPADFSSFGVDTMAALRAEVELFNQALPVGQAHGHFDAYSVVSDSVVVMQTGTHKVSVARLILTKTHRGTRQADYFYVTVVGHEFVKVRVTHRQNAVPAAQVDAFVRALLGS